MRLLATEDEVEDDQPLEESKPEPRFARLSWRATAAVAAAAALPRLLYVFVFSKPDNPGLGIYDDVWHHWQIAYLTKEIGLSAPGGPRLWDLKGLDYFWGILHPLLMTAVFALTGSIDIVLLRLVSLAFGVLGAVLIFHICNRLWNTQVAVGAALFAIFLPTSVMNDASGMLEPMGVALCLLGIWAWVAGRGWWSGLAFGLATMARAEAWIFGLGLVIAAGLKRINVPQRAGLWFGFAATVAFYMAVLLAKTGNPIYPLWWNFFANALGTWGTPITSSQVGARPALAVLLAVALGGLVWTLKFRPHGYILFTYGFGYTVFTAGMLGFTSFLSTWQWWMPISRRFEFPYEFAGIVLAVVVLYLLPQRFGVHLQPVAWAAIAITLLAAQFLWLPISHAFGPTESAWKLSTAESAQLARFYSDAGAQGHAIAVPDDRPDITYGLARFGDVEGKQLVSEMYDPFAYLPAGYAYAQHQSTVDTLVRCWLTDTDVRLIAIPDTDPNLALVREHNPAWFRRVGFLADAKWDVEAVSVPPPTHAACEAARSASL